MKFLGSNDPYIIAEVGQAHEGSLGILHSYIDAAKAVGADAVKFQTHIAVAESSEYEPFRVNFSYEDRTRYEYWERMSFTAEQWQGIKKHCDEVDIDFISSPFSIKAIELLDSLDVRCFKVGSGEVTNGLLLNRIASTGRPVILSSGLNSFAEIDDAIIEFQHKGYDVGNLGLMQCTSEYPVEAERIGLNVISEMRARYPYTVGLSDHSSTIYPCIAAAAQGAKLFEAHIVFDRSMFGPDSSSSLTLKEFKKMVEGVRYVERIISNPVDKDDLTKFKRMKSIFEKSLAVNKNMEKGTVIRVEDLETKKPLGYGIPASQYQNVIGKRVNKELPRWSFLNYEDVE